MVNLKIATISYLNSIPFVYGLESSEIKNDLILDNPSACAQMLLNDEVDIALVPVDILPLLKNYHIVGNSCIGSNGKVETVCLFSDVPLNQIDTILLDYQSRTSVALVKVLCYQFWNIKPKFIDAKPNYESKIKSNIAGLIIGDRAYDYTKKYRYVYDLSEQWQLYTKLPFVFACWVSTKKLESKLEKEFNQAISFGISNLNKALAQSQDNFETSIDKKQYLTEIISYKFDNDKQQALKLFLSYVNLFSICFFFLFSSHFL